MCFDGNRTSQCLWLRDNVENVCKGHALLQDRWNRRRSRRRRWRREFLFVCGTSISIVIENRPVDTHTLSTCSSIVSCGRFAFPSTPCVDWPKRMTVLILCEESLQNLLSFTFLSQPNRKVTVRIHKGPHCLLVSMLLCGQSDLQLCYTVGSQTPTGPTALVCCTIQHRVLSCMGWHFLRYAKARCNGHSWQRHPSYHRRRGRIKKARTDR